MKYLFRTPYPGIIILTLTHLVGVIGLLHSDLRDYFLYLTPFHLLISTTILLLYHGDWSPSFFIFAVVTVLSGFFVEVLGIQTGEIFGTYSYGAVLGPGALGVPFVIGVNWLMLIYATGVIGNYLKVHFIVKATAATLLMIVLDLFIEPVAVFLNFWTWEAGTIPIQNYVGWAVISFVLLCLFFKSPFKKNNPVAVSFYIIQLGFFSLINMAISQ